LPLPADGRRAEDACRGGASLRSLRAAVLKTEIAGIGSVSGDDIYDNGGPGNHAKRRVGSEDRFGLLLLVLICAYVLSAFTTGRGTDAAQLALYGGTAILSLRTSSVPKRHLKLIAAALIVGSGVMVAISLTSQTGRGIADVWIAVTLLFVIVVIVRSVLSKETVTIQSIYGAFSAYMIVGLMFASVFAAIDHLGAAHFFADHEAANTETFQYFSFTTLTTLGYGDFTAVGSPGRAIAVLEALTGQVFLATLVARLVAGFRPRREPAQ
jgi:hypothetical protein